MTKVRRSPFVIAVTLAALLSGCKNAPPAPTVTQIQIVGPSILYAVGEVESFTATVDLSDGEHFDVSSAAVWSSSDTSVVTAAPLGHVTAVAAGAVEVSATYHDASGTIQVRVVPPDWTYLGTPTLAQVDLTVDLLAVDPRDEETMYVGTDLGLYVTRNGGGSWERPIEGFIRAIALDPNNPDRVYATAYNSTANNSIVARSENRGASFVTLKSFDDIIDSVLISKRNAGTIYLGYGGDENPNPSGTFKSTDDGATWVRQPFGVAGYLIVWDIGEDTTDGTLYAGTEIADHPQPYHPPFFRSTDGGATWVDATGSLPWHVIHIAVNSANHDVLALTEGAGLYESTDEAHTWTLLNNLFGESLLVDPGDPTRVFGGNFVFGNRPGGAFISRDSASHFWPYGLSGLPVTSLALNGLRTRLYAASYNSGLYVTDVPQ